MAPIQFTRFRQTTALDGRNVEASCPRSCKRSSSFTRTWPNRKISRAVPPDTITNITASIASTLHLDGHDLFNDQIADQLQAERRGQHLMPGRIVHEEACVG